MTSISVCGRDERGSIALWVVFATIASLALGGLVIDGGYQMAAKREAARAAEQAARAGSDELDLDSVRTGGSNLNGSTATSTAQAYLSRIGESGRVRVDGAEVTVTVTKTHRSVLLGGRRLTVQSRATASSIDGPGGPD